MVERPRECIAVYKGAFDMMHNGHVAILEQALADSGNKVVYLYPAGRGRLPKTKKYNSGVSDRREMARRVVASLKNSKLQLNDTEMSRPLRPNYVLLIDSLISSHPGKDIAFYAGSDSVGNYWKELAAQRILSGTRTPVQLHFRVSLRGTGKHETEEREKVERDFETFKASLHPDALRQVGALSFFRTNLPNPVSSTLVRELIAQGQPFEHLVPAAVADYIKEHELYGYKKPE